MLTIDPIHNLFLGTAKYMMGSDKGYLNAEKLRVIERLSKANVASTHPFGRLPSSMDATTNTRRKARYPLAGLATD